VLAVVVAAALLYIFYKNVIPVPAYPVNLLPWIFLGLVVLGMAWYTAVRLRKPEILEEAGSFEEEPVAPHPRPAHHGEGVPRSSAAAGDPEHRP
jgi:hypothetical protein